uniref:Uncharacterized protein n=1 Tax=Zea mays TaxID=4577 RepID=A0A804QXG4_MAIZE
MGLRVRASSLLLSLVLELAVALVSAQVRDQLRADRERPPGPGAGGDAPAVDGREQGEAVRRGPPGADGVRQHGRRLHHRRGQRGPAGDGGQPGRGAPLGGGERAALRPGHAHHLRHRRQRGPVGQRHGGDGQPAPGHEGRARRARRRGPRPAGRRLVGALRGRARHQLPAVVGRVPGGPGGVRAPHPRLPRADGVAVPRQRVPLLLVQGEPGAGAGGRVAAVRAVPAQPGRARPGHRPHLRQHAVRADRRRVRRHAGRGGARGRGRHGLGDRVAVQGRRRRARRHGAERRGVQRQPHAEGRRGPGHAAQARRARRRVRVRALQRGLEARAHVGAELRPALPRRLAGVRARRRRSGPGRLAQPVLHVHVLLLLLVRIGGGRNLFDGESGTITAAASNCNTPTITFVLLDC